MDKFEVSAEWMKACGKGNSAKVFDVVRTVAEGRNGLTVIEISDPDTGRLWQVIPQWRGRYV
jgi:hypothetical protein